MVDFLGWLKETWRSIVSGQTTYDFLSNAESIEELEAIWAEIDATRKLDPLLQIHYRTAKASKKVRETVTDVTIEKIAEDALSAWLKKIEEFKPTTPEDAKKKLAGITAEMMKLSAAMTAADIAVSKLPWVDGAVIAGASRRTMAWLGFGAVMTAVAHDPVKIGMLRPYQDALEMTFRNRRPDDYALFQAYRTRELSPIKVDDLTKLTDAEMNRIEKDNDDEYFKQISRWGYSESFATALSRSATRTLNFSQLATLARAGIYDRGLFIYSLWGEGLDRVVMPAALNALETLRDREMYSGFRSMIEPSFIEGDLSEAELKEYWTLAGVPGKVQDWVIVRLRKRRETYAAKQTARLQVKERDLTVSQITQAYTAELIKRVEAFNSITALGYSQAEADILLNLAETRRKAGVTITLKRLPLSDYEKAYKSRLISLDVVLTRMQGEYAEGDIALEKKLLEAGKA